MIATHMQVNSDVLVIGSGIAGLMAALAARDAGASVTIVSKGAGSYAISSGCVDLLGYVDTQPVEDPWSNLAHLPDNHPYRLLGQQSIEEALAFFCACTQSQSLPYSTARTSDGKSCNSLLPTVLGTLKPSYLLPATLDASKLFSAKKVLICGCEGLRDMSPKLCRDQLLTHSLLEKIAFETFLLPQPFAHLHRSISALDLARFVNTKEGESWLATSLGRFAKAYDCILLPPILGTKKTTELVVRLEAMLGPLLELLSIPPGVGGISLQEALLREASQKGIRLMENVQLETCEMNATQCLWLKGAGPSGPRFGAKSFVLATGGVLGGGLLVDSDRVQETVFHLPCKAPRGLARTGAHVFSRHPIQSVGIAVDSMLRPVDQGNCVLENVFLAGRILEGYDHAHEKCGHGVAIATGWRAGRLAAEASRAGE